MNIFSFTAHFDSEESCRLHFKEERDKIGVNCQRCGHGQHYWIKAVWGYECKSCGAYLFAKRNYYAEFKPILYDLVQDHVFDNYH